MNSQPYSSTEQVIAGTYDSWCFYTETIEVQSMSPFAFFNAGKGYTGQRMFWQNRESTFTFVGLGHAHVITSHAEDRFESIKQDWQSLCRQIVNEEPAVQPVLFGGFSFDPENEKKSVWRDFSPAYFAVPTFQLTVQEDQAFVSIHLITQETNAFETFEQLRKERDELVHVAQVSEPAKPEGILVTNRTELEKDIYMQSIQQVTEAIRAGEADKVVIARQLKLDFEQEVDHADVLQQVGAQQQGSFLFGLEAGSQLFFGATPERLVKVTDNQALSTCLAGSIPRGRTAAEDTALGNELMNDDKNRSEHAYVVNMISSVFRKHCSSAVIPNMPELMKIRDIQHLYTPVEGELKEEATLFDLVQELHPTPALGGEPRTKAMQLIRKHEPADRGYYAAPLGWIDAEGNGEFAVAIRSALLDGQSAYLYAGGGIVADSTPELEYAETWVKFRPMLRALGGQLRDES
ncbi:isochorismate synthase [Planococcus lenghuensis]|uniref:isochorismate synthase n=1 Tax=Planococcus lenghuensis TaxID=2213202 RepID=A0A1Q2KX18_9BACL|nr:isochorismate synthase [Planococcus lenghuensis]AQQ52740.1 isochorismate synthase [Planococcus lenghuensis]